MIEIQSKCLFLGTQTREADEWLRSHAHRRKSVSLSPTRWSSPHSRKRSIFAWSARGISPISSRNSVSSIRRFDATRWRERTAPVKAPRVWPKSSASSKRFGNGRAVQHQEGLVLHVNSGGGVPFATSSFSRFPSRLRSGTVVDRGATRAHEAAELCHDATRFRSSPGGKLMLRAGGVGRVPRDCGNYPPELPLDRLRRFHVKRDWATFAGPCAPPVRRIRARTCSNSCRQGAARPPKPRLTPSQAQEVGVGMLASGRNQ